MNSILEPHERPCEKPTDIPNTIGNLSRKHNCIRRNLTNMCKPCKVWYEVAYK